MFCMCFFFVFVDRIQGQTVMSKRLETQTYESSSTFGEILGGIESKPCIFVRLVRSDSVDVEFTPLGG